MSREHYSLVDKVFTAALTALVFAASLPVFAVAAKLVEREYLPVVSRAEFTQVEGRWSVKFEKLRDCDLLAVYWFTGTTWERQEFPRRNSRPLGPAFVEDWPVAPGTDPATDPAITYHNCHPLWITKSDWHDPSGKDYD